MTKPKPKPESNPFTTWLLLIYGITLIVLLWWVLGNNYSKEIRDMRRILCEVLTRQNLLYKHLGLKYINGKNEHRPARIEPINTPYIEN